MARKELLEQLEKNLIGLDDTFKFQCKRCGNCCCDGREIMLMPYDLYRIAKHLKLSPRNALDRYCIPNTTSTDIRDGMLRLRLVAYPAISNYPRPACIFFNGQCSIQGSKPVVCTLYPLGRCFNPDTKEIHYSLMTFEPCINNNEKHTVREWLTGIDIKEFDEFTVLWDKIFHYVRGLRKFKNWEAFFEMMYLNYDITQSFLPQLQRNADEFRKRFR